MSDGEPSDDEPTANGWNDPESDAHRAWPYRVLRDGGPPRRPFSALRYWTPGAALALVVAALSVGLAAAVGEFGWLTLCVPVAVGSFFGYGLPVRGAILTTILAAVVFVSGSMIATTFSPIGLVCGLIVGILGAPLAAIGVGIGAALRSMMRGSRYYQTRFLPLVLAAVLAGPGAALEARMTPANPPAEVATASVVDASPGEVWSARLFSDACSAEPSPISYTGLPAPTRNRGSLTAVGDVKTVPLGDGVVRLRVTRSDAPYLLAFEVIEQTGFEDRTARLIGGEMRIAGDDQGRSEVTLTTTYEPLLGARAVWGPIERLIAHELQDHVLREVRRVVRAEASAERDEPSDALHQ